MSKKDSSSGKGPIGYGRPPAETRFKKGKSGNPSGKSKSPSGAASEFDVAMRALTRQVTARIGEKTEKMTALDAIHRKRSELALKGVSWAVRGCCEDAKAYGLASHARDQLFMRVKNIESVLPSETIAKLSDEQLRGLIYLLETVNPAKPQTPEEDQHPVRSGEYMVGVGTAPNIYINRPKTAVEAHEIVLNAKKTQHDFKIFDTRGIEITERGLDELVKREAAKTP